MARKYTARNRYYQGRNYSQRAQKKMGVNLSTPFIAGAALGFTDHDKVIPPTILLGAATAPIRGIGIIKAVAQGVIFGNLIQGFKNKTTGGANLGGNI